jgi:hypothetical protein
VLTDLPPRNEVNSDEQMQLTIDMLQSFSVETLSGRMFRAREDSGLLLLGNSSGGSSVSWTDERWMMLGYREMYVRQRKVISGSLEVL